MPNKKKASKIWKTWWSVIGPKLPHSEIALPRGVFLAPLTQQQFVSTKDYRMPPASFSVEGSFVVHYPPWDAVQSHYKLQIDVEAADDAEALDLATTIANRLLMSLTLTVPGGRYHAELRMILHPDGKETTGYSEASAIAALDEPKNLEAADIEKSLQLVNAIENDQIAEGSHIHLLTAWQLHSTPGSKPLERSILMHYFMCIEGVAKGTMAKLKPGLLDKMQEEERLFAVDFAKKLADHSKKPKAIREASTTLRNIRLENTVPMIAKIGPYLKIDEEYIQYAIDLFKYRSDTLSHAGKKLSKDEIQKWLGHNGDVDDFCLADRVARTFLRGYCDIMVPKKK